jgi:hypothetical protein
MRDTFQMNTLFTLGRAVEIVSINGPPVRQQHHSGNLCYN